jgi:hypothetical protein
VYAADERGFLSVEPYATVPGLSPFHGLVAPDLAESAGRMAALVEWLGGPAALSGRSRRSVELIGTELSGYPQLAGEARYAAGQIAHVATQAAAWRTAAALPRSSRPSGPSRGTPDVERT